MMGGQVSPRSILIVLNVLNTRCNAQMPSEEMLLGKLEQTREVIERVNLTFKATKLQSNRFGCWAIKYSAHVLGPNENHFRLRLHPRISLSV